MGLVKTRRLAALHPPSLKLPNSTRSTCSSRGRRVNTYDGADCNRRALIALSCMSYCNKATGNAIIAAFQGGLPWAEV